WDAPTPRRPRTGPEGRCTMSSSLDEAIDAVVLLGDDHQAAVKRWYDTPGNAIVWNVPVPPTFPRFAVSQFTALTPPVLVEAPKAGLEARIPPRTLRLSTRPPVRRHSWGKSICLVGGVSMGSFRFLQDAGAMPCSACGRSLRPRRRDRRRSRTRRRPAAGTA